MFLNIFIRISQYLPAVKKGPKIWNIGTSGKGLGSIKKSLFRHFGPLFGQKTAIKWPLSRNPLPKSIKWKRPQKVCHPPKSGPPGTPPGPPPESVLSEKGPTYSPYDLSIKKVAKNHCHTPSYFTFGVFYRHKSGFFGGNFVQPGQPIKAGGLKFIAFWAHFGKYESKSMSPSR